MRYLLCLLVLAFTARAELKTDIEFAKPGGASLTLDAFVPDGAGPFPTCILVHGGGWHAGSITTHETAYRRMMRWADATEAYRNVVRLSPPDAANLSDFGEAQVMANQGIVPASAHEVFSQALAIDPTFPKARFYDALALKQEGKTAEAKAAFEAFLKDTPADAPWRQMLLAEMQDMNAKPPALDQQTMADASNMSADDAGSVRNDSFVYHGREGENIPDGVIHVRVHPSVRVIRASAFCGLWLLSVEFHDGLEVIKKYIEIDPQKVKVDIERGQDMSVLEVNIELPSKLPRHQLV